MQLSRRMRATIQNLYTAQQALRKLPLQSPERVAIVKRLTEVVPAPILAHFLRLVEHGQNGVSLVRHGVCSGCHIRVPLSSLPALVKPHDVHLCDHCGSYLLLPDEEIQAQLHPEPVATPVRTPRRRAMASAVS